MNIETIKRLHNVYDDMIVGNIELAHKELGKILNDEQLTIPVVIVPFVCVCPDENWVYDESGVDMYCKKCSGEEAN